jgi:hypothetical protein
MSAEPLRPLDKYSPLELAEAERDAALFELENALGQLAAARRVSAEQFTDAVIAAQRAYGFAVSGNGNRFYDRFAHTARAVLDVLGIEVTAR